MIEVTFEQWKKAMEGLARKDVGPFTQLNTVVGGLSFREYYDGDALVMRMTTHDHGINPSHECEQLFEVTQEILDQTSYIYIPTDEEWEEWDERNFFEDGDIASEEIAKRENR